MPTVLYNVCGGFAALIRQDRCRKAGGQQLRCVRIRSNGKAAFVFLSD